MILSRQRKLERETLIRIAGTPTRGSSDEAKSMAKFANEALRKKNKKKKIWEII
jgi:hypothetical protein